jgi:RimJ/RimL family protein N-acetyltransferase
MVSLHGSHAERALESTVRPNNIPAAGNVFPWEGGVMNQQGPFSPGPQGVIRQLRPSELPRFREHLLRLDPQSRRDRFNGAIDDDFVIAYAERCFTDGTTVIGYVDGDRVLGAAELHERVDLPEPTGEIAFSVERGWQGRGIGSALFERLIANAYWLGYAKLRVTTHPENGVTRALARKFGAHLHFEDGDTVGEISLPPVMPFTSPYGHATARGGAG